MTAISNPRLRSLRPDWAPFRGFTLLFDNPGGSVNLRALGGNRVLENAAPVAFYEALERALAEIGGAELGTQAGLGLLPPQTWHVTAWDGINDSNLAQVLPASRAAASRYLASLPQALAERPAFIEYALADPYHTRREPLAFEFAELLVWHDAVLAVRLAPTAQHAPAYRALCTQRGALNERFRERFGTEAAPEYRPHVTLGYFANPDAGRRARRQRALWQAVFERESQGHTLELARVRLFGFTDLVTFLCP